MTKTNTKTSNASAEDWILAGIPFIFVVGSIMHFVYEWSGNLPLVGIFAPINESVWEHLKMAFWPALTWWIAGYFFLHKTEDFRAARWFSACATAVATSLIVIVAFFYTYTCGFGIHSLALDIFSFLLGVAAGQVLGLHVFKYANYSLFTLYVSLALLIVMALAFAAFTFDPPDLPIFKVN